MRTCCAWVLWFLLCMGTMAPAVHGYLQPELSSSCLDSPALLQESLSFPGFTSEYSSDLVKLNSRPHS